jgi:ethanolamine ammonia-lyase large subunit
VFAKASEEKSGDQLAGVAAAVVKLMRTKDLVVAASKARVVTRCRNTMGERGVIGVRAQPNHPAADLAGVVLSAIDVRLYGCGDAVIGVNPATEAVETVGAILKALAHVVDRPEAPAHQSPVT